MSSVKFVRYVSISQSAVVGNNISNASLKLATSSLTSADNLQAQSDDAVNESRTLDVVEFKTLNNPSTVLTVNSPPSYPVYIKRGSLLSIYGSGSSSLSSVRSQFHLLSPFWAMLYGGRSSQFQKFISTKNYSLLVSSIASSYWFKTAQNKTLATLELDGTNDWALFPKDALHAYTGTSLGVSLHTLPSKISRKLAQTTNSSRQTSTGLFNWANSGFTLLSGRGMASVVATGSIYLIDLKQGEEILINRRNLVAITVKGSDDLQNCIMKNTIQLDQGETTKTPISTSPSSTASSLNGVAFYVNFLKKYWSLLSSFSNTQKLKLYNQMIGNKDYIKVLGPRTLLLQTSNSEVKYYEPTVSYKLSNSENLLDAKSQTDLKRNASDYLSYVTITPKGAVFESTPDFLETVNKLKVGSK